MADDEPFVSAGERSGKVKCRVCGAKGYDVDGSLKRSWKVPHLRGHAPCPRCGRPLTLMINGKPRTHGRCPA